MRGRRPLLAVAVGVPLVIAALAIPLARRTLRADTTPPSIAKLSGPAAAAAAVAPPAPTLQGLDLTKIEIKDPGGQVVAPLPEKGKVARLSVDSALQRVADSVMQMHHLP